MLRIGKRVSGAILTFLVALTSSNLLGIDRAEALSCVSPFTSNGSICTTTVYSASSFTVPYGVSSISVVLVGGAGGTGGDDGAGYGGGSGPAGKLSGALSVSGGDIVGFYPGSSGGNGLRGSSASGGAGGADSDPYGTFNGGAGGRAGSNGSSGGGGGGGGATTVRIGTTLAGVAGGAGGGGGASNCSISGVDGYSTTSQISTYAGGTGANPGGGDGGGAGGGGGGWNGGAGGTVSVPGTCGSEYVSTGGYRGYNRIGTGFNSPSYSTIAMSSGSSGYVSASYTPAPSVTSISITSPSGTYTNATSFTYSVSFDSSITDFEASDIAVMINGSSSSGWSHSISGSGSSYTVTSSNSSRPEGTIAFRINEYGIAYSGVAGYGYYTSSGNSGTRIIDATAPSLSFSPPSTPNNSNPVVVQLTSSETLSGLAASDFTATGCTISLSGSSSPYSLSLADCTEGSITLSMTGDATDTAGNSATKPASISFTADRSFAAGMTVSPSTPNNLDPLSFSYTPGEPLAAGAALTASEISVSGTGCTLDAASIAFDGSKFDFDVAGCADTATAQVSINSGALADEAGNTNSTITFSSVVIDSSVGVNVIGEPANTQYNSGAISFTLSFSESISGLTPSDLAITGGSQGCTLTDFAEQNSITSYVVSVTGCADGASVRLTLGTNSVFDALGNYGPSSPVQSSAFTIDLTAPELSSVTPRATIQNTTTVVYDVVFSEPVSGVASSMFTTSSAGCSAPALTSAGGAFESAWVVTLTGCSDGAVELAVAATSAIEDAATNQLDANTASATMAIESVTVDTVAPTGSWQAAPTGPLNTQTSYDIDFSEAILFSSFTGADISNSGTATGCVFVVSQLDADSFRAATSGCTDGTLQPVIAVGSVTDLAGNALDGSLSSAARTAGSVTLDFTAPSVSFSAEPSNPTNASTLSYQVTFNEPVQTPSASAFAMLGGVTDCAIVVAPDNTNPTTVFDLTISSCSEGLAILTVNSGSVADIAGNLGPSLAVSATTLTIDRTAATVAVVAQTASPTKETTVVFGITFAEQVSSLTADSSHFNLSGTGCTLGTLSGTQPGTTFTLSVNGCDVATDVQLSVVAGSVVDLAGNASPSLESSAASITTDRVTASVVDFSVFSGNDNGAVTFNLDFDEAVSGLTAADFSASGVTVSSPFSVSAVSSTQYRISVQALSSGNLTLTLGSGTVTDGPGNLSPVASVTSAQEEISFDALAGAFTQSPTLTSAGKINSSALTWRVAVTRQIDTSDSAKRLTADELSLVQGTCSNLSVTTVSATTFEITASGCTDGATQIQIAQDAIVDPDGNSWPSAALDAAVAIVDTTAPTAAATSPTGAEQLVRITFQFDFSENISGLTLSDFAVSAGSTATGCQLSYVLTGTRAKVQAAGCSDGSIGVTLAANSVSDEAGITGPSAPVTASSVNKTSVASSTHYTPATNLEPVLMATAPARFVGPLTSEAAADLVAAGVVSTPEGAALQSVAADFTQFANPTANSHIHQNVTLQVGEALEATLAVDPSFVGTREAIGYLKIDGNWVNLGTTEVAADGVVTVPATFANPGNYFMRVIVQQPLMQVASFNSFSLTDPVMELPGQALELDITVSGTAMELVVPVTTAPSYDGPIITSGAQRVSSMGGEVSYQGAKLESASEVVVSGVSMSFSATATELRVTISALEPGSYAIQIRTDYGLLTVQDALEVTLEISLYEGEGSFFTKRISETEIKVYAKDIVGLGKIQFFVNGEELAWVRAADETDPKLRVVVREGTEVYYLVRTVQLDERVRIEIRVNGERAKFATYSP